MSKEMYPRSINLINNISKNRDSSFAFPLTATREFHQFLSAAFTCTFEIVDQQISRFFTASSKFSKAFESELNDFLSKYLDSHTIQIQKEIHLKHAGFSRCLIIPFVYSIKKRWLLFAFDYTLDGIDTPQGIEILNTLGRTCAMSMKNKLHIESQAVTIKKLEEKERSAQKHHMYFKQLFDNMSNGVAIYTPVEDEEGINFIFKDFNRAAEQLEGVSKEQLIGKKVTEVFPGIKDFGLIDVFKEVYQSGNSKRHPLSIYNSGSFVAWRENEVIKLPDGSIVAIYSDYTSQKNTESDLKNSEEKTKKILNSLVSGLYIYDFEKQSNVYINPAYTKITGWTLTDIKHMGNEFIDLFHKEDLDKFNTHMDSIENSGSDLFKTMEYRFKTKYDGWKWLLTYDVPFERRKDGRVKKILGTFIDISDRMRMEKALFESEKRAIEANKAKSEFIANMSHEIRTPLNGVIGFTDLLMTTQLDEDQQRYIKNIQNSSIVLMDLISDILDFSKIEAGKFELEREEFNLPETLKRSLEVVRIKAQEKNFELLFDYSTEAPIWVYGDAVRLRQVILNFLGNSVKFTQKGEIELAVDVINWDNNTNNVNLKISVRDTGIGIPEDQIVNILEKFSQADNSITRKYGGTGLGLAISKKIIERMGSQLNIKSQLNMGSEFSFEIKMQYREKQTVQHKKMSISKVLVVDDNKKNLEILEKIFTCWDVRVEKAENGFEALNKIETLKADVDVIIMDYAMPYMNGIETLKHMKEKLLLDKKPRIILYSSVDREKIRDDEVAGLIDKKMMKPVTMEELREALCEKDIEKAKEETKAVAQDLKGTILIVEDNQLNRDLLKKYLKKAGDFKIFEAENGKKAIELYAEKKELIDLIFMDIQMPEVDGYRAASEIRSIEPEEKDLTIVALTARNIKGEENKIKKVGMDNFITKPLRLNTLKDILKIYLSEAKNLQINSIYTFLRDMELKDSEIEEICREYKKHYQETMQELILAVEKEDFEAVEYYSHNLKGTSANIGNKPIAEIMRAINNMMKEKYYDIKIIQTHLGKAEKLLNDFLTVSIEHP